MFSVASVAGGCSSSDFSIYATVETAEIVVDPNLPLELANVEITLSIHSGRYVDDDLDLDYVSLVPEDFDANDDDELRLYLDFPADFDAWFDGVRSDTVTLQNDTILNANLVPYCGQSFNLAVLFDSGKAEWFGFGSTEPVTVTCLE